ncbi:uncharacterized protein LOC143042734 [Mytilus galloprovincialis]|uniref:uncharacterized protein LOC143042734 n=1 Tax=Mytilus galloprovincialis TaxID=29158 RepID=UPI003F7BDE99
MILTNAMMGRSTISVMVIIICIECLMCKQCPNQVCTCYTSSKLAKCSRLTYIPTFPKYVKSIHLQNNKLYTLTRHLFSNITRYYIQSLSLVSNSVRHVDDEAFIDLKFLRSLEISNEKRLNITYFKKAFSGRGTTFEKIRLEDNGWAFVPDFVVTSSALTNITEIHLGRNSFSNFSMKGISNLKNLKTLDMSQNKLITFIIPTIVNIRKLILNNNDIVRLPRFCVNNSDASNVPRLRSIFLNENALSKIDPKTFNCLPSLEILQLNGNRLNVLLPSTFETMPQLKNLSIEKNKFTKIYGKAFQSLSLHRLNMGFNNFHFHRLRGVDLDNIFLHNPKLKYLDLTSNFLIGSHILHRMFRPLTNLTNLNLHSTRLTWIPPEAFQSLRSLKRLTLQGNSLSSWNDRLFKPMNNLRYLNLQGNYISLINESSFPDGMLNRLEVLDLSKNHFACTCDLMWFRDWIRNKNLSLPKLINFPRDYKCIYPEKMHRVLLKDYNPTKESCTPWNPLFTIAITLASFTVLCLVLILAAYKCHSNIRNYCYLFRLHTLKRKGYIRLNSSEDYEYHAFVVYCDSDRKWVHNIFLPKLENEGFKLCIHFRDFDVGVSKTENVDTYLKKCWKIIVIMSNEFAKSEWCQWELEFSQDRRRRQGRNAFLPIMLKTINSKHMISPIRTLLKTTPYVTHQTGVGEDLFWKAVIEGIQKPLGNPPVAV